MLLLALRTFLSAAKHCSPAVREGWLWGPARLRDSSRCREASRGQGGLWGGYSGASSTESQRCMGEFEKGEDRMASRGASPVGVLWELRGLHPLHAQTCMFGRFHNSML